MFLYFCLLVLATTIGSFLGCGIWVAIAHVVN